MGVIFTHVIHNSEHTGIDVTCWLSTSSWVSEYASSQM